MTKTKLLRSSDCPNVFKMGNDEARRYRHLWQDTKRVAGSVCIRGTRMPVYAVFYWLIPQLLEELSKEQWAKGVDGNRYTREQVEDCLDFVADFFHETKLDLTNPLLLMTLELFKSDFFYNPEGRVDENTVLKSLCQPDFHSDQSQQELFELSEHLMEFLRKLKVRYDAISRTSWEDVEGVEEVKEINK